MTRMSGMRASPRIHLDDAEEHQSPLPVSADKGRNTLRPVALDTNRLRRLSFGGRGGAIENLPQRLDRPNEGLPVGRLVPLPLEKPKFHHGEARVRLPKRPEKPKPHKPGKRGKQQSIGDEDFGQSTLLDEELRGTLNARTIAAASMEMARPKPQQQHGSDNQGEKQDSIICKSLMAKAPHGHEDTSKYWTRSLRMYTPQTHPEEFALIQLKLAQTFYATAMLGTITKDVLKNLESCLQHYNVCLQLYNQSLYPRRWGIAALEMGMSFGAMADLVEQEIPLVKPDPKAGSDAEAGFYKEVGIMTNKASDYRQRSLDNIESAREVLKGRRHTEERAKAQVEYARGVLRRLAGDLTENRELAVFSLESAIQDYEILIDDKSLQNEDPDNPRCNSERGPAHAYQIPVTVPGRDSKVVTLSNGGGAGRNKPYPSSYNAEAEEQLPLRLRGIKAAYGRALGTAGKLCLDKHASAVGRLPESAVQAWEHLMKAVEVIPDYTRDRAEALLLLARATIEQSSAATGDGSNLSRVNGLNGERVPPSEAMETGIAYLRAALETCPNKQLALRQEIHWNLGRLALSRLQHRLRAGASSSSPVPSGRTPLILLARAAESNLKEAVDLAEAAASKGSAGASPEIGRSNMADAHRMRAREALARVELAKLLLAEIAPEHHVASAIDHLRVAQKIHPLESAPSEFISSTCLLAEAFRLAGDLEGGIKAYREAARGAPLLGNQLHFVDASLNPGAILSSKRDGRPTSEKRENIVPPLGLALRGLFGGGIECCLELCRETIAASTAAGEGGLISEQSFRSVASGAGSMASGARSQASGKQKRKMGWAWVPDEDGSPGFPSVSFQKRKGSTVEIPQSATGDIESAGGLDVGKDVSLEKTGSTGIEEIKKYSMAELSRWKPGQLKGLLSDLSLDTSGCLEKRDIVEKIARHPEGLATAAAVAVARGDPVREKSGQQENRGGSPSGGDFIGGTQVMGKGKGEDLREMKVSALKTIMLAEGIDSAGCLDKEDLVAKINNKRRKSSILVNVELNPVSSDGPNHSEEQDDNFAGMTLADYMNGPPEVSNNAEKEHGRGQRRGSGGGGSRGGAGHLELPVSGSWNGGRPGTASATSGGRRVVRLAPAHIAPPSRPAPEWVVDMQRESGPPPPRKVVINRPLPFSAKPASRSPSARNHRSTRRRSSSSGGGDAGDNDGILRAQSHALQAFRFHCRSGQLFLAEQLALAGVWNVDTGRNRDGATNGDNGSRSGSSKRVATSEGLRTAWMASRLKPAMRLVLEERRERIQQALEDVRRFTGPRGAIFVLPRVGVQTGANATKGWGLGVVTLERDIVRELKDFEKWLARGGVWAAQPALVMLTTCGTAVPRGLRAATGKDGAVTAATAAVVGEYVGPSDYPTDEALAEMVDTYEALLCWFYLPADGDTGEGDRGIVGSGDTDNAAKAEGGGDYGRNKKPSEHSRSSRGVVCFVAYRDEPKRRPGADASHNGMSKSRLEKNAQEADVEQERNETEEGAFQNSGSSSSGDSNDSLNARKKDVDAEDFEPGPLRVRVVLGNPRTTKQLRKATGVFLSASRNRNPVKRIALSIFSLHDLSAALGIAQVLKALPPHVQEIIVVHHGLLGVVPVHALPLEEQSSKEPGRPGTVGRTWRPPSPTSAGGAGLAGRAGAASAVPLVVLDRYSVRYTSSLYALEIAERATATAVRDTPWYFNTCCVVEDPLREVTSDDPQVLERSVTGRSTDGEKSLALHHSRHEGRVVRAAWSPDPDDCHFCRSEAATQEILTTITPSGGVMPHQQYMAAARGRGRGRGRGGEAATTLGGLRGAKTPPVSPREAAVAAAAETARVFASKLNQARCLHLCCTAIHFPRPGLLLCRTSLREVKHSKTGGSTKSGRGGKGLANRLEADHIGAASLLQTIHLRSCGLVVLSRGGVIDNIRTVEDAETRISAGFEVHKDVDIEGTYHGEEYGSPADGGQGGKYPPPLSLAEAFIASGAQTIVQKLWYDEETALADTVTLLAFYEELREATIAGEKRPVVVALREAQLWLKNATLTDILTRVQDARGLSVDDSKALVQDLSSFFKVMVDRGSGAAVDKPFNSPYYWAGFQAIGSCGAVQSLQSLEGDDDDDADSNNDGVSGPATSSTLRGRAGGARRISSDSSSTSSSSSSSGDSSSGAAGGGGGATATAAEGRGGRGTGRIDGIDKDTAKKAASGALEKSGRESTHRSGESSGSSGSGNTSSGSSGSGSSSGSNSSSSTNSSSSNNGRGGARHGGGGLGTQNGERRPGDESTRKDPEPPNKALKAVGSAYDIAGRLGEKLMIQATAAIAAPRKSPPGTTKAATMAAAATGNAERPKSTHPMGSTAPASLVGENLRPAWGKKATGNVGGNCIVS